MKTEELVEWVKEIPKHGIIITSEEMEIIKEIIKRLEELEELKKQRDKLLEALIDCHDILTGVTNIAKE